MHRNLIKIATLLAGIAVLLGAFGAHTLKGLKIEEEHIRTFQTGVTYQFYHSLGLLCLGILSKRYPNKFMEWAGVFFVGGIILFSGSLYILTFLQATKKVGLGGFGALTPIGGLLLVAGWVSFFLGVPPGKRKEKY
jgi:uncharacterized membrane protein YgdD (TMEM256/DUF423 family)